MFYFVVSFLLLLNSIVTADLNHHTLVCEHQVLRIKCEQNQVIHIVEGNYGRTTSSDCATGPIKSITCTQQNSISILSELCEGKHECAVEASNGLFGDPCVGTLKYLSVQYQCVNPHEYKHAIACENDPIQIECDFPSIIQVTSANYGRLSLGNNCPKSIVRTVNCKSQTSAAVVSQLCDARSSCAVIASNAVFGDPCGGTQKYLSIKYKCVPHPGLNIIYAS